jgi:hypothetical protein
VKGRVITPGMLQNPDLKEAFDYGRSPWPCPHRDLSSETRPFLNDLVIICEGCGSEWTLPEEVALSRRYPYRGGLRWIPLGALRTGGIRW